MFQYFNGIWMRGVWAGTAVLYQLRYKYSFIIYLFNLPMKKNEK